MKKIIILLLVAVSAFALLLIVKKSIVQDAIEKKIEILQSNGLKISDKSIESNYINTKRHYEFSLQDTQKFVEYLNQYSDTQLPPYIDSIIEGVVMGVDMEYSNYPLSSKLMLDIYPLSLPKSIAQELKREDVKFYTYIKKLLESRGVLYHINYDISDEIFDGFIKNMDENYLFDNGTKINLVVKDALYNGKGSLIAPQNLQTDIKNIAFFANSDLENIAFDMKDFLSSSTFKSHSTYKASATIEAVSLLINEKNSTKMKINMDGMGVDISSNIEGKKAKFHTRSSLKELKIDSADAKVILSGFNYDISLDGVDKDSYEKFRKLTSQLKATPSLSFEEELKSCVVNILSKGLIFNIADLSVEQIGMDGKKPIDAFTTKAKLVVAKDVNLAKNIKTSPMVVMNNISLTSTLKFSKDFYTLMNREVPATILATQYAKEKNSSVIFDIELKDGHISVNNKMIN